VWPPHVAAPPVALDVVTHHHAASRLLHLHLPLTLTLTLTLSQILPLTLLVALPRPLALQQPAAYASLHPTFTAHAAYKSIQLWEGAGTIAGLTPSSCWNPSCKMGGKTLHPAAAVAISSGQVGKGETGCGCRRCCCPWLGMRQRPKLQHWQLLPLCRQLQQQLLV
jgi:hypothetical protein